MRIQDTVTVKTNYDAINNRTFEANAKNYVSVDYVGFDVPTKEEFRGLDGYLKSVNGWLTAFPDGKILVGNQVVFGSKVTTTYPGKGTFTGKQHTPHSVVSGNGRKCDVEFREEIEVRNDKIVHSRLDYDSHDLMRQLGLEVPTAARKA